MNHFCFYTLKKYPVTSVNHRPNCVLKIRLATLGGQSNMKRLWIGRTVAGSQQALSYAVHNLFRWSGDPVRTQNQDFYLTTRDVGGTEGR